MLLAKLVPRGPGRFLVSVCGAAQPPASTGVLSNFGEKNYLQKLMLTFIGAKSVTKAIKRQNLQYIKNS